MTHSTRFERLILSATAVASVTLWGLWASAAPVSHEQALAAFDREMAATCEAGGALKVPGGWEPYCEGRFDAEYELCDGLAGIAYSVAIETGHTDPDAAYEDTLAACMTSRGRVTP